MARDAAASVSAADDYSCPIHVICVTSATARSLCAEQRAKLQAKPAGLPSPRTTTTSAGPFTSPAARPGERVIPATRARPRGRALRLKTSQRRKTLVSLAELAVSCAHRHKIS